MFAKSSSTVSLLAGSRTGVVASGTPTFLSTVEAAFVELARPYGLGMERPYGQVDSLEWTCWSVERDVVAPTGSQSTSLAEMVMVADGSIHF